MKNDRYYRIPLKEEKIDFKVYYKKCYWEYHFKKKEEKETESNFLREVITYKIDNFKTGDNLELKITTKEVINFLGCQTNVISGFYLSDDGFLILKLNKEEILREQKNRKQNF